MPKQCSDRVENNFSDIRTVSLGENMDCKGLSDLSFGEQMDCYGQVNNDNRLSEENLAITRYGRISKPPERLGILKT